MVNYIQYIISSKHELYISRYNKYKYNFYIVEWRQGHNGGKLSGDLVSEYTMCQRQSITALLVVICSDLHCVIVLCNV